MSQGASTKGATRDRAARAVLEVELGAEERAVLREAARLTGLSDPDAIVRVALAELVERRRFQTWVETLED